MCIGLNRRSVPTGGFGSKSASAALLSNTAMKANMLDLQAYLQSSNSDTIATDKSNKHHITVQHNYHDHSGDMNFHQKLPPARGGVITPFPLKLHEMLVMTEKEGLEHIVSWQPHGRCFIVHNNTAFANILTKYFKVSKVSSFQRQLNLYGFQRITKGRDKGAYYHELFLRGKAFLAHNIQRNKVKGTKIRARSNPDQEPNFYSMPWVLSNGSANFGNYASNTVTPFAATSLSTPLPKDLEPVPIAQFSHSIWDLEDTSLIESTLPVTTEEAGAFSNADLFFEDFDFPDPSIFGDIENDDVFGNLLEQMIAE